MRLEDIEEHVRGDNFVWVPVHQDKNLIDGRWWQTHSQANIVNFTNFPHFLLGIHIHKQNKPMKLQDSIRLGFGNDLFNMGIKELFKVRLMYPQ